MKLVIQRVNRARVLVADEEIASIGRGFLILCGVAQGDTPADREFLARKTMNLRVFDDAEGRMNLGPREVQADFLVVSQFTLFADCARGNRPSYLDAALPDEGEAGYEAFAALLREGGFRVQTGRFAAHMRVELENDGPVTIPLESRGRVTP
ncbi:MAG: D-aminoacyl-tRNA deacylase [Kiritimatiellae bacterium]|nr:D-aminoacyl-tRNA deacylase [Kiritimatiellia bacterium]MCO5060811.1 D-aminoacyl-tRNA deacylase [Kiritimatiellia bacterium]MCO6399830.1 D-tyrosyl-tRNA(Tyr) deacylase [Verrucomicrobiota bacterium]